MCWPPGPFLRSCQHWPACRGAGLQPRPSLTEAPGVGGKEGLCDLRGWDRGQGRGGGEAPSVCPPLRDEHCRLGAGNRAPLMPRYSLAFRVTPELQRPMSAPRMTARAPTPPLSSAQAPLILVCLGHHGDTVPASIRTCHPICIKPFKGLLCP